MHIPFSAPNIPELDTLPERERTRLMHSYATSANTKRLIRLVQACMFLSLAFVLLATNLDDAWRVICAIAAPASLVLGVVVYRVGANRALRELLNGA